MPGWLLLLLLAGPARAFAQGLPFHTPSALTTAFEERGVRGAVAWQSRGDLTDVAFPLAVLPFAPHERLTTTVQVPVVFRRMRDAGAPAGAYSVRGLGDLTVSAKLAFLVRNRFAGTTRLALILAAVLPTGATDATMPDGLPAPRALQLGAGAPAGGATVAATIVRDRWALSAAVGHIRHGTDGGFRLGPRTVYDVAVGVRIPEDVATLRTRTLQLYVEWNGRVTGRMTASGAPVADTGGHVGYLSPGVQWVLLPRFLIEGSLQIPVLQDHNGVQPDYGLRPALGARLLFL